jgi:hypothetical protein
LFTCLKADIIASAGANQSKVVLPRRGEVGSRESDLYELFIDDSIRSRRSKRGAAKCWASVPVRAGLGP